MLWAVSGASSVAVEERDKLGKRYKEQLILLTVGPSSISGAVFTPRHQQYPISGFSSHRKARVCVCVCVYVCVVCMCVYVWCVCARVWCVCVPARVVCVCVCGGGGVSTHEPCDTTWPAGWIPI
jgi:hypothetical protein